MTEARGTEARGATAVVEIWRGDHLECVHRGHIAVARADGDIVDGAGDAGRMILPRSSCKPLQALALVESGAADAASLSEADLALACASHEGAAIHTNRVAAWLEALGMGDGDLRCGAHAPRDPEALAMLRRAAADPTQIHNNCSGKHAGFLTLTRHLGAGPDYIDPDHPTQQAVSATFHEVCGAEATGFAIDGCSAPNHAVTLAGLAEGMARMARPLKALTGARAAAAERLVAAMMAHPELVAGENRACTDLMRAAKGAAAVKTGAEGVFAAILPELGLGVALKIEDGATRASNALMATLLADLGVVDPADPQVARHMAPEIRNHRGVVTGRIRARLRR